MTNRNIDSTSSTRQQPWQTVVVWTIVLIVALCLGLLIYNYLATGPATLRVRAETMSHLFVVVAAPVALSIAGWRSWSAHEQKNTAKQEATTAQVMAETAKENAEAARSNVEAARENAKAAKQNADAVARTAAATEQQASTASDRAGSSQYLQKLRIETACLEKAAAESTQGAANQTAEATRDAAQQASNTARTRLLEDRFHRYIGALEHQDLSVRVGGILGLEELLATEQDLRLGEIVGRLCALVRQRSRQRDAQGTWAAYSNEDLRRAVQILGNEVHVSKFETLRFELSGADLRFADLSKLQMQGANLQGADLTKAEIRGTNLTGADLSGARLVEADMTEAICLEAELSDANLTGTDLSGTTLERSTLDNATLLGAIVSDKTIFEINSCKDADLRFARAEPVASSLLERDPQS